MTAAQLDRLTRAIIRSGIAIERLARDLETVIDHKKRTLRMVDVERGKVYKTHLGKSLRKKS